jgi:hypothetical protein
VSWDKGAETIEKLLAAGHLEQVLANPAEAQYLLAKSRTHLATAALIPDRVSRCLGQSQISAR